MSSTSLHVHGVAVWHLMEDFTGVMRHELGDCQHTCGSPYQLELHETQGYEAFQCWTVVWSARCPNCLHYVPGSYVPMALSISYHELSKLRGGVKEIAEFFKEQVIKSMDKLRRELSIYAPRTTMVGSDHMARLSAWLTDYLIEVGEATIEQAECIAGNTARKPNEDYTASEIYEAAKTLGFLDQTLRLPPDHPCLSES